MSLLPRSLFGRLVLVLIGGLVVAQLLSALINFAERDRLIVRYSGMQTAQRIADIVRLLETLPASERQRIVAVLDAAPLRVSLDTRPLSAAPTPPAADARDIAFAAMLKSLLGEARAVRIVKSEHRGMGRHGLPPSATGGPMGIMGGGGMAGPGHMRAMGYGPGGGLALLAQVRLKDGAWVTFDSFLPRPPDDLPQRLLLSLLILLGAVVVVSLVAVRWVTRPLHVLAAAADDLGQDIHRPPLDERGPAEVSRAARAFNTMQARLQRFIDERVRVLRAISHDLKTPLTRMRLRAELLDDEALRAKFEQDLGEMETMVGRTLEYLRGTGGDEAAQPIDITALLESLQEDARETGYDVVVEGAAAAPLIGKPQQIKRCLANLVDNALRYGQRAMIAVEDDAAQLRIRVRDDGPGILETDLERVFEPYFRLDASRSRGTGGTGLGLGIARNIARAHGGDLVLHNRPAGGLEALLSLSRNMTTRARVLPVAPPRADSV
jgi:signal transduction histidine kinase